ncbi:MAG: serine O-acetyltransferase [Clostridia bacterium]|nr:serine O-acetyltransferase [Clostridia bacterium]
MFSHMSEDIHTVQKRDVALRHPLEALLCYPGMRAVRRHRRAHSLYTRGHYLRARLISNRTRKQTLVDIHPGAQLGEALFIDHGCGIVIGETAIVGDHVTIYHGVTLGATGTTLPDAGHKRHPTIEDHVLLGAGAKILGNICIGHHAKIGAGAVVLHDVPPYATAVGNPARIILKQTTGKTGIQEVPPC